jgi:hypothetical protein
MQQVAFDHLSYARSLARDSQTMALDALHRGVLLVAASEGLDTACFEEAHAEVLRLNFVNEWIWPRRIASPNRMWRAFLLCRHEADRFVASLTITDRAGRPVAKVEAVQAGPSEFQFVPQFGIVKWVAPTRVAMLNRRGEEVVALDVE